MNYENYDDLYKAKKRIMSLMKTKYGDLGDDYQESVDIDSDGKMNNIIKQLNEAHSHSFNMIPFIKKEADRIETVIIGQKPKLTKKGKPYHDNQGNVIYEDETDDVLVTGKSYFRNVNALVAFNQQVLSLSSSLTSANRIFRKLIDDIGYVEPQTLDLYKQSYDKYLTVFNELNQIAVVEGKLKVIMKDGEQNEFDRNQLINEFNNARLETIELVKFNDVVRHNYNNKSSTVSVKKNNPTVGMNSKRNYYNNDDE